MKKCIRFAKIEFTIVLVIVLLTAIGMFNVDAACSGWTFHQTSTKCITQDCGPGGILETKMGVGTKTRYCNKNNKQVKESLPATKVLGCCQ